MVAESPLRSSGAGAALFHHPNRSRKAEARSNYAAYLSQSHV